MRKAVPDMCVLYTNLEFNQEIIEMCEFDIDANNNNNMQHMLFDYIISVNYAESLFYC
jgi:hypothetical protein